MNRRLETLHRRLEREEFKRKVKATELGWLDEKIRKIKIQIMAEKVGGTPASRSGQDDSSVRPAGLSNVRRIKSVPQGEW